MIEWTIGGNQVLGRSPIWVLLWLDLGVPMGFGFRPWVLTTLQYWTNYHGPHDLPMIELRLMGSLSHM